MNKKKLLILFILVIIFIFLSGCNTKKTDINSLNEVFNIQNFLATYIPVHNVGNGSNNFWINHPTDNQNITHTSWVNNSLEKGCVFFVVHKTGCVACQPQADRCINLSEKYGEEVEFHDLDIELGGSIRETAYESYNYYDPDGPPGYIALTGVFTLVNNSGTIEIGWHSWEKDVDYSELESWIKDAIYYYHINSEG
jgi:hypothetical protein